MPMGANALARMDAVKQHATQLDDMQKEYAEVAKKRMAMKEELTKACIQPTKARPAKDAMPPEMMATTLPRIARAPGPKSPPC